MLDCRTADSFILGTRKDDYDMRVIDMLAPIAKGSVNFLVAPGSSDFDQKRHDLLWRIARSVLSHVGNENVEVLLLDERPETFESVSKRLPQGISVFGTTHDLPLSEQIDAVQAAIERLNERVQRGNHVFLIIESITRYVRVLNGYHPKRMFHKRWFWKEVFDVLQNARVSDDEERSLTILASFCTDTGSRADEMIFEWFTGTADAEIRLDPKCVERRDGIAPFDVQNTWCRPHAPGWGNGCAEADVRNWLQSMNREEALQVIVDGVKQFESNELFLHNLKLDSKALGSKFQLSPNWA